MISIKIKYDNYHILQYTKSIKKNILLVIETNSTLLFF